MSTEQDGKLDTAAGSAAPEQGGGRKPGTFKKGDARINRSAGPKGKDGRAARFLRDMRHVYSRPESADRTEGQRNCRQWLKDDRKAFMAKLADLEKAQAAMRAKGGTDGTRGTDARPGVEAPIADAGTERAIDLCERLLKERPWARA